MEREPVPGAIPDVAGSEGWTTLPFGLAGPAEQAVEIAREPLAQAPGAGPAVRRAEEGPALAVSRSGRLEPELETAFQAA
jgi:hypothetical protein